MSRVSSNARGRDRIRPLNQSAVIHAIHRHGRISRTDLAAELRLSPAAITAITAPFVEEGLVMEAELGTSTSAGRKPILLGINYDHAYVIGAKVMNHGVVAALTNLGAEVLRVDEEPVAGTEVGEIVRAVAAVTGRLRREGGVEAEKVLGLGVNLPGIVDHRSGTVRHSPLFGWAQVPIAERLREAVGLPVLVENDVNALAAAQAWFGLGRRHDSFLVVTVGRGVGLGIVIDGKVYRGPRGGAGEVGHTSCTPRAPRVMTTETTTLEQRLGDAGLLRQARALLQQAGRGAEAAALDEAGLSALAANGDRLALDLLHDAGGCLGVALADVVNVFAPAALILAGEGLRNAPYLLPAAREALAAQVFGDLGERLDLLVDSWADEAWARGAAGVVAARLLEEASIPLQAAQVHVTHT